MSAGVPALAALAWVVAVGAAIGSFLNVVVVRVPAGESIARPGSRCPRCKTPIRWYDHVPIVSWILLRARCRSCGERISIRYPLVEAAVAAAALAAWMRHGFSAAAAAELGYVAVLLALALIDFDTWLLPHVLTRPLLASGLLLAALGVAPAPSLRAAAYGAALGFAALWLVGAVGKAVLKKEAMGGGDLWLLAALGAWNGVGALLPILLLASVQGSIVGIVLILAGRGEPGPGGGRAKGSAGDVSMAHRRDADEEPWVPPRHAVPFGPFLVAGALEWLYLADELVRLIHPLEIFR